MNVIPTHPKLLFIRGAGEFFVRMIILSLSINNKKAKDVIMDRHISKISSEWIRETRAMFIQLLEETGFQIS